MANPTTSLQFRELSTGRFRDVTTGRFIPNPIGIAQLAAGAQMVSTLKEVAEVIANAARQLASAEAHDTGAYERGIRPAAGIDKSAGIPQAVAQVNAFDYKSHWIEFGTIKMPARRILQRAAEASGYQVVVGKNVRRVVGSGYERVIQLKGR